MYLLDLFEGRGENGNCEFVRGAPLNDFQNKDFSLKAHIDRALALSYEKTCSDFRYFLSNLLSEERPMPSLLLSEQYSDEFSLSDIIFLTELDSNPEPLIS